VTRITTVLAVVSGALLIPSVASATPFPAVFGPPLERYMQDMSRPTQTAVGDFDQDGKLDMAAVSLNGQPNNQLFDIALMRGQGNGLFDAATSIDTTDGLNRIVVGKFNSDTDPDLAVSLSASGQILVFFGAAGMTFTQSVLNPISLSGSSTSFDIASADFNGDSHNDLAVADNAGGQVEIFTGAGNGTFSGPTTVSAPGGPIDIATGEFNGDSDPDLAVALLGDDQITVLTGGAGATFTESGSFDPGSSGNMWVGVADFDNDSDPDLAVANATSDDVKIFKGGLGSTFSQVGGAFTVPNAGRGTIADFNDDGDEDLAVPSSVVSATAEIYMVLGDTGAAFVANHRTRTSGDEVNGLSNGNFDTDTRTDLVAANPGANSDNVVWLGSRPPEPVIGGTTPPSGGNNNTPKVFGDVATGSVVDIYKSSTCAGLPDVDNATKAEFAAGVAISPVGDNSSTPIAVIAEEGTRKSTCSVPIAYVEDSDFDNDGQNDEVDSDDDNDGVPDTTDNCDLNPSPDQTDTDADGQGNPCDADDDGDGVNDGPDNCDLAANPGQADMDGDGLGDACDSDADGDGAADTSDNCPGLANPDQKDTDADGQGDACDNDDDGDGIADSQEVASGTDPLRPDTDADGRLDTEDNCPVVPNADQRDGDSDGVGTACDPFELLPGKCANPKGGTRRGDRLTGSIAGDALSGLGGNDVLVGLAGDDCLSGGRGKDRLSGGPGNDTLSGGPGKNRYSGGAGKDRINARNRVRETVSCGPGKDRARVDASDRTVGCERVRRR
jgi:hypothetical protein